jgi:hypothetical protein
MNAVLQPGAIRGEYNQNGTFTARFASGKVPSPKIMPKEEYDREIDKALRKTRNKKRK